MGGRAISHSRVTGGLRLGVAVYLIAWAAFTLADPQRGVAETTLPMAALLPLAGLSFTAGVFLLTGFMSRVCGLILACLGAWQLARLGFSVIPLLEALVGVHFMLRGGGAWAMDIYVRKMQDRARRQSIS